MNENEILCLCMGVTRADITAAIAGGARNFDRVCMITRCAASCGVCADKIHAEMERLLEKAEDNCDER